MRNLSLISLILMAFTGCTMALEDELFIESPSHDGIGQPLFAGDLPTEPLALLSSRSEVELAELFAQGTATTIPEGENDGVPLLPGWVSLVPVLAKVYEGSIWEHGVNAEGETEVRLRDKFLRTSDGHLLTLFEGEVSLGRIADVEVGGAIRPPSGTSWPHPFAPATRPIVTDDRPSLFVNYHEDPTPIVNRILDEIREVDADGCPGLFLGRAHYRMWWGRWVYLYWFALDFGREEGQVCDLGF